MKRVLLVLVVAIALAAAGIGYWAWRAGEPLSTADLEAAYLTPADRYLEIDGVKTRVRVEGPETAPVMVMLHGYSMSLETWDAWAGDLKADHRVIRFDLPGHGLTGPDPERRYSVPQTVAFLDEVLDELGVESATLIGNSLGGLVAWRYAVDHPSSVDALILLAPGGYPINGVTDEPAPVPAAMKAYLTLAPEVGVKAALQAVYGDPAKVTEAQVERVRDMMRMEGVGAALIERLEVFTLPDPEPLLVQVTAPTLILWGAKDVMVPVADAEKMAARMADARVITYADLGHMPQEEAPERSLADVRAFLAAREG